MLRNGSSPRESPGTDADGDGEALELHRPSLSKIEYGQVNLPATTLIFLADFFHVTTDYLLGRD